MRPGTEKKQMQIYMIRHGRTAGNLEHRYVGVTDEAVTVEALQELRKRKSSYPKPDCIFSSPMRRCTQTAEALFPEIPATALKGLRECEFGQFEYKNYQELQGDARYQAWIDSGGTLAFPGGESRETFAARCCRAFAAGCHLAAEQGYHSAAFVVHGGTIMAILDRYSKPHRDYFDWQVRNGEGFAAALAIDGEGLTLSEIRRLPAVAGPEDIQNNCRTKESRGTDAQQSCRADATEIADAAAVLKSGQEESVQPPFRTGIEDQYVMKNHKKLRCGYTTGSCAAAAAKAAAEMLLTGHICRKADLMTPKGILLHLPIEEPVIHADTVSCAVRKFAGDDPDATDGILIYAEAKLLGEETDVENTAEKGSVQNSAELASEQDAEDKKPARIVIDGGTGVGRITKPGLEQPVGAAAINRVPREMIRREVESVCEMQEYHGRIKITISAPEGVEIGKRTFNPHIGILGGISILGTSGIVMPMSEEALIASIRLEMKQKYANGERYLLITPGNYGADFIRRKELSHKLDVENSMKCSNYVGETVDMAVELGFAGILFVAHIGKFIKVSGGIMNTHSAHADCRAELIAAQMMRACAKSGLWDGGQTVFYDASQRLLGTNTTEEAVGVLLKTGLLQPTMAEITSRIKFHLQKRCQGKIQTEAIVYSNQFGYLGETDGAEAMMDKIVQGD